MEQTALRMEQTALSTEQTALSMERTALSTERTALSTEQTALRMELNVFCTEQTAFYLKNDTRKSCSYGKGSKIFTLGILLNSTEFPLNQTVGGCLSENSKHRRVQNKRTVPPNHPYK